jgi:hypothetical protein
MFSTCQTHGLCLCDPNSFERCVAHCSRNGIGSFFQEGPVGQEGGAYSRSAKLVPCEVWECERHMVIIPKYGRKVFYGRLRRQIGPILRDFWRHARDRWAHRRDRRCESRRNFDLRFDAECAGSLPTNSVAAPPVADFVPRAARGIGSVLANLVI